MDHGVWGLCELVTSAEELGLKGAEELGLKA